MSIESTIGANLSPHFDQWLRRLANQPSKDGVTFCSIKPLRNIFLSGVLFLGGAALVLMREAWVTRFNLPWNEFVALVLGLLILGRVLINWPPKVIVVQEGLRYERLLRRRLVKWDTIESVIDGPDGELLLYLENGNQLEISPFVCGRKQLKNIISARKTHRFIDPS